MRKIIVFLWISFMIGMLVATPELTEAGNVNPWIKVYSQRYDDEAWDIALTPEGDIIIVGRTSPALNDSDVWVVRLDPEGNIKWQKAYGGPNIDVGTAVSVTPNGYIIVVGYYGVQGLGKNSKALVLKLDSSGNIIWQRTYEEGTSAEDVVIDERGDIIVVGYDAGMWVLKLDSEGNIKWQRTYSGFRDSANAVAIASNGDIIVAGFTKGFGVENSDAWVVRLDQNGNIKWQKAYGGPDYDEIYDVVVASNGDILLTGYYGGDSWSDFADLWVLKLDEDGNVKWQKTYGGELNDHGTGITITSKGDVIVTGYTKVCGLNDNIWVLWLDRNGNIKRQKTYGRGIPTSMALEDGTLIVAGYLVEISLDSANMKLMKLPEDGEFQCDIVKEASNFSINVPDIQITDTDAKVYTPDQASNTPDLWVKETHAIARVECPSKVTEEATSKVTEGSQGTTTGDTNTEYNENGKTCGPASFLVFSVFFAVFLSILMRRR